MVLVRWAVAVVVVAVTACADRARPRPVLDEDLSIGPHRPGAEGSTLAETRWTYCAAPRYGATFRRDGKVVMRTETGEKCSSGQWTQDGTAIEFTCDNFWKWTGTVAADEIKGTWVSTSRKGEFCMRRAPTLADPSADLPATPEPSRPAQPVRGGGGDTHSLWPATQAPSSSSASTQSKQKPAISKPKTGAACPAGWHERAGRCYSCVEGDTYTNGMCLKPCPAGSHEFGMVCITCTAGGEYQGNGTCSCPRGSTRWNEYCVTCPPDATYSGDGKCRRTTP
jgi:hypothetical protein